jgi:hypothetical protein
VKKFGLVLLIGLLVVVSLAEVEIRPWWWPWLPTYTVAELYAARPQQAWVSDGLDAWDCRIGGGDHWVRCVRSKETYLPVY